MFVIMMCKLTHRPNVLQAFILVALFLIMYIHPYRLLGRKFKSRSQQLTIKQTQINFLL